jgi:type I restriction enzyme, R subunit
VNKRDLSEADIKEKFITLALTKAGWDEFTQIGREIYFTDGRIYVKGKITTRGKRKFADYILFYKPNIPIAVIEAKDNNHSVKAGIQQALGYSSTLDVPFAFSSNGDAFYFHDKTVTGGKIEKEVSLDDFPDLKMLWQKYQKYKGVEDRIYNRTDFDKNIVIDKRRELVAKKLQNF